MESLSELQIEGIRKYVRQLTSLYPEIDTKMVLLENSDGRADIKGAFTMKAPYYLALYSEEKEGCLLNAGFLLEQMVLYFHSRGIGSCYLGYARIPGEESDEDGKSLLGVLAFGSPKGELSREQSAAKRKSLKELCVFKEEAGKYTMELLEAARMAPSAINQQPWRFVVYQNRIHVFMRKSTVATYSLRKLDRISMGAMLCHMMTAADELWLDITMKRIENIRHKLVPNNQYVTSILIGK